MTTESAQKPPLKDRFNALLAEYGRVALIVYFTIFGLSLAGFSIAIRMGAGSEIITHFGIQLDSTAGEVGTFGIAWLATKVIQPFRILGTLVLTPIVAKVVEKLRKK